MALNTAPRSRVDAAPLPRLQRKDTWWTEKVAVLLILGMFSAYAAFRAFENNFYSTHANGLAMHYLSPFYSPPIQDWFHPFFSQFRVFNRFNISPALFVLVFPLSFRGTCYFCRRTYYRAVFGDPSACAVKETFSRPRYAGERAFPWMLNNLHRFTLYAIFVYVVFHWIHLAEALQFTGADGQSHFGLGLGTIVLGIDAVGLSLYVFSCHSFRHIAGGVVNKFSNSEARYRTWKAISALNERHGLYFWVSLFSVGLADVYVRLVCMGAITDLRLF